MSWQQPNPARHEVVQRPVALRWFAGACPGVTVMLGALGLALLAAAAAAAEPAYVFLGQAAPDFALHAAGGENVRLSEHRGEVVVLSYWSSRCISCRTQLSAHNRSLAT